MAICKSFESLFNKEINFLCTYFFFFWYRTKKRQYFIKEWKKIEIIHGKSGYWNSYEGRLCLPSVTSYVCIYLYETTCRSSRFLRLHFPIAKPIIRPAFCIQSEKMLVSVIYYSYIQISLAFFFVSFFKYNFYNLFYRDLL